MVFIVEPNEERPGRAHERLTAALAECLREVLGPNSRIQTPERVVGRSGTVRDVDVSARGDVEGRPFFVAIECKDYAKARAGIEIVDAFVGKLADIDATIGIMVVSLGYTRDALKRAASAGIQTYVLREATESELNGRMELAGTISVLGLALRECEVVLRDGRTLPSSHTAMFRDQRGRRIFIDRIFEAALARMRTWDDDKTTEVTPSETLYFLQDEECPEVELLRARPRRITLSTSSLHVRWDALLARYGADGEPVCEFLSLGDLRQRAEVYRR